MKFFENYEQREMEGLAEVQNEIRRHEHRERIHRCLIAGLSLLAVASFFAGHCANDKVRRYRKMHRR